MTHAEKIVQEQLDYYNANDLDRFASTYADGIEIRKLDDNALMIKGKEALREKYKERFDVQKVKATLVNRMTIGNKVIDHEEVSGIIENQLVKAIAVYEVTNDLITKVWFMFEE